MSEFPRGDITVVRAVLPKLDEDNRILLIRRAFSSNSNRGMFELPGGKVDPLDATQAENSGILSTEADLVAACIREVKEESGFNVRIASNNLSVVEKRIMQGGLNEGKLYVALAGVARIISGELALSPEHIEAEWVDPANIPPKLTLTNQARATIHLYNNLELGITNLA